MIHMQYKNVGIPKPLADRFDKIRRYYGYRSFSEFVNSLVRDGLQLLETKHEFVEFEKERRADEHD